MIKELLCENCDAQPYNHINDDGKLECLCCWKESEQNKEDREIEESASWQAECERGY